MRDLRDLARELGRRDAAEMQAGVARRRHWVIRPGPVGTVAARLDGDRLLADCPFCPGAELVTPGVGFFCMSCGMQGNGGHPMTVQFPGGE